MVKDLVKNLVKDFVNFVMRGPVGMGCLLFIFFLGLALAIEFTNNPWLNLWLFSFIVPFFVLIIGWIISEDEDEDER